MIEIVILINLIMFLVSYGVMKLAIILLNKPYPNSNSEFMASLALNKYLRENGLEDVKVDYNDNIPSYAGLYKPDENTIYLSIEHLYSKKIPHIFIALHEARHAWQFRNLKPISVNFFPIWKYCFYFMRIFLVACSGYCLISVLPISLLPKFNIYWELAFLFIYILFVVGQIYTRYWIERDSNNQTYIYMLENGMLENEKERKRMNYFQRIHSQIHYFAYCFVYFVMK